MSVKTDPFRIRGPLLMIAVTFTMYVALETSAYNKHVSQVQYKTSAVRGRLRKYSTARLAHSKRNGENITRLLAKRTGESCCVKWLYILREVSCAALPNEGCDYLSIRTAKLKMLIASDLRRRYGVSAAHLLLMF